MGFTLMFEDTQQTLLKVEKFLLEMILAAFTYETKRGRIPRTAEKEKYNLKTMFKSLIHLCN